MLFRSRVDFLARRTKDSQEVKTPAMVVTYNSEDLVYTGLKLKAALKGNPKYKQVFFRKSVPNEYKKKYIEMDKVRQSFYNAKEGNRRVYESRIDFISHYMCLKVKTIMGSTYTPWTIYSMWAPGYDEARQIGKPNVQPVVLPVIVAKIIPLEGNSVVPHADRDNIGNGYRQKLNDTIKHKCIYAQFNDRGSIFNKIGRAHV